VWIAIVELVRVAVVYSRGCVALLIWDRDWKTVENISCEIESMLTSLYRYGDMERDAVWRRCSLHRWDMVLYKLTMIISNVTSARAGSLVRE
jgi:hypothetical protein